MPRFDLDTALVIFKGSSWDCFVQPGLGHPFYLFGTKKLCKDCISYVFVWILDCTNKLNCIILDTIIVKMCIHIIYHNILYNEMLKFLGNSIWTEIFLSRWFNNVVNTLIISSARQRIGTGCKGWVSRGSCKLGFWYCVHCFLAKYETPFGTIWQIRLSQVKAYVSITDGRLFRHNF